MFRSIVLAIALIPFTALAQSAVPVSATDKLAVEKAQVSLSQIQAEATTTQATFNTTMASLKWKFTTQSTAYSTLLSTIKKRMGLSEEATFDGASYAFNIPTPTPPAPVTPPVAPKK